MDYNNRRSKEKAKKSSLNPFLNILQNLIEILCQKKFFILFILLENIIILCSFIINLFNIYLLYIFYIIYY